VTRFERSRRWYGVAFRIGYADAQAGVAMRRAWTGRGRACHAYGMGYFHGRAHSTSYAD
jgi:hypothetical protein